MNINEYSKTLLKFKGQSFSVIKFLGIKWIILKLAMLVIATFCILQPSDFTLSMGIFIYGYVFGVIITALKSQMFAKKRWPIQQKLYDWGKIETYAGGKQQN